jgi:Putative Flp pilus-assembly TadE/G-like/D-alanyl-D-alanine carboxypeptidase
MSIDGITRAGPRTAGDRGQATPLAAAMVAIVLAAMVGLVPAGRALADRAHARTAADAAALAGAVEGEATARSLAEENGAELLAFRRTGTEVVVRVRVGVADAYARARASGARSDAVVPGRSGGGDRAGLAPAMLAALARADSLLGRPVQVVSGLRTRAEQEALWERRHTNPYPVARPGTSDHERGLAIDIPRSDVPAVLAVAAGAGLCQPLPDTDPVHFVACPGGG